MVWEMGVGGGFQNGKRFRFFRIRIPNVHIPRYIGCLLVRGSFPLLVCASAGVGR